VPEKSEAQRLVQMRTCVRSFSASITDDKGGRQELRMLPQPVFRYRDGSNDSSDGGLFVFARSPNPEVLLLIETRPIDGVSRWHFAPARMTGRDCELRLSDEIVWSAIGVGRDHDPQRTYLQLNTRLPD